MEISMAAHTASTRSVSSRSRDDHRSPVNVREAMNYLPLVLVAFSP